MKYFLILLFTIFVISCSGSKKVIESESEPTKEILDTTKIPVINNIKENEEILIEVEEVAIEPEKGDIVEDIEITEDLGFNQNVTKRFLKEHQLWSELLEKHVSDDGKVNYSGLKKDDNKILGYISLLQMTYEKVNLKTERSKEELLAFWINAYNALTIDLILRNYPIESIKDIKDPWDQRLWKFGDKWQNLNDIEHKILREMDEPRIHFAIVCASESCPKLQNEAFTSDTLEEQLTNATKEFLADSSKNELSKNYIKLSKIFKWFKKDFEHSGSLIDFLNQYSDISISDKAKKSFKDYSWELNN
jgi:hypothetical protein